MSQTNQPPGTGFSNGLYVKLADGTYVPVVQPTGEFSPASVTLEALAPGISPAGIVKFADLSSFAGGTTTQVMSVPGITDQFLILAMLRTSTNPVSIVAAVPSTDQVTIHYSADPGVSLLGWAAFTQTS